MTGIRVAASLWSVAPENLDAEAARLADAGLRVWHWDRADGSIGPAGGFTAAQARRIAESTGLASEAHLMLVDPLAELDDWLAFCEVVVVHLECRHLDRAVARIEAAGVRAAVAYSPASALGTPLSSPTSDALVMSVQPGHGGSEFRVETLDRVASLVARHPRVGVDGGVTPERARDSIAAGASWIVSGTALIANPAAFLAPA